MTKILILTSTFPRWMNDSMPRFILDMAKSLKLYNNYNILVLCPHTHKSKVIDNLEGINVIRYIYFFPFNFELISGGGIVSKTKKNIFLKILIPFFILFQIIWCFFIVIFFKPDIIISNWIYPQGLTSFFMKSLFKNIKTILISHGGDLGLINKKGWLKNFSSIIINKHDLYLCISSFLFNFAKNNLNIKTKVETYNIGIDINNFKDTLEKREKENKIIKNTYTLLFVGRLEEKKGVSYLIEAIKNIKEEINDIKLIIIGDGSQKKEIENLINIYNLKNNIDLLGSLSHNEIKKYFEICDIFVSPFVNINEDFDSLPRTLLEASACKIPIISTNAGGITDFYIDNYNYISCKQKDPIDLKEKIIYLLSSIELRKKITENAYNDLINKLSLEKTGNILDNYIKEILNKE